MVKYALDLSKRNRIVCVVLFCESRVSWALNNINDPSPTTIQVNRKERKNAINEMMDVAERHIVRNGSEDSKVEGSQVGDMSR